MPRTTMATARRAALGAVLAVSLLLTGCSDDGAATPTGQTTATTGDDVPTAVPDSAGGQNSSGQDSSGQGSSGQGTDSDSAAESGPMSMATTSEAPSSRPPKPTPASPKPSGTGVVGTFSKADTAWFDSLCSGLANKPRTEFGKLSGALDSKRGAAAELLTKQADQLDQAASQISGVEPPKVEGGSDLATAVGKAFPKMADAARAGAANVKAATDEAGLEKAFDQTLDAVNEQAAPLSAFDQMMGAPAMVERLKSVPSCAPLVG